MHKAVCTLAMLAILFAVPALAQHEEDVLSSTAEKPKDRSNLLSLVLAAEGGGSFFAGPTQPGSYAGLKAGVNNFVLSFGYDRIQAHNGFSGDLSYMVPMFRFPGPQKNDFANFVKIYAEPGIGNRSGEGAFGPYLSGKVMVALFSDNRLHLGEDKLPASPYIEFQRRFPFQAPGQGDNRITFGLMLTLCGSC